MHKIPYTNFYYKSESPKRKSLFPSLLFYIQLIGIVIRAGILARLGLYDGRKWMESSFAVMRRLERVGVRIEISGIENLTKVDGPVVFIGNHMSMMETLLLPVMIQPVKEVTFVVKDSLLSYPVFKHVLRSRNPIAVTRTNPRQDLKTVMNEGGERLKQGVSIIVFPQTTRSHTFDSSQMNSIGVKLAKRAGVPVIPVALKTDCWQNGKKIKDLGRLDVSKTAHFSFGQPIGVESKGEIEQETVNAFIVEKLKGWSV